MIKRFSEKYCPDSDKENLENKEKIVLSDRDFELIDVLNKINNTLNIK